MKQDDLRTHSLIALMLSAALAAFSPVHAERSDDRFVDVGDAQIYYEVAGEGPPIVLVHGANLDHRMWDEQMASLVRSFQVIRYDVRPFGRSGPQTAGFSHVEDLGRLLDHLNVEQASLVGLSLGGRIVLDFALEHPERVTRMVLASPGLTGFKLSGDPALDAAIQAAMAGESERAAELSLGIATLTPAMERPETAARLRRLVMDNTSAWTRARLPERLPVPPTKERLGEIHTPTLLVLGERDVSDIHDIVTQLESGLPNAQRVILSGVGHMPNLEAAAEFNRLVYDFLANENCRDCSERKIAIRGARVLDVESGVLVPDTTVVVIGERIAEIGPASAVTPPHGAAIIELPKTVTLLPGLIDAHVHLTIAENPAQAAEDTLLAGFTTVQDLGAVDEDNLGLRDAIAAGRVTGPRVVSAGRFIGVTGGTCDFGGIGVNGPDAFATRVGEDADRGADLIKLCFTAWPADASANPDQLELSAGDIAAAMAAAAEAERKVVAHAISEAGARAAVDAGVAALAHAAFADTRTARKMIDRQVYLIPTLWSFSASDPAGQALFKHTEALVKMGVPVAFGTDAGVITHGLNAREFQHLVDAGLSPLDAVRTATVNAAELLGRADDLGSISVGKYADLIGVNGNPLEDVAMLEKVGFVMQGGRVVRNEF